MNTAQNKLHNISQRLELRGDSLLYTAATKSLLNSLTPATVTFQLYIYWTYITQLHLQINNISHIKNGISDMKEFY